MDVGCEVEIDSKDFGMRNRRYTEALAGKANLCGMQEIELFLKS